MPDNASIIPSVTMKLGTFSTVVANPFMTPTSAPSTNISSMTGRIIPASSPIMLPASTTCMEITAPMERSNSPETIT